jgi:hypothetical protein
MEKPRGRGRKGLESVAATEDEEIGDGVEGAAQMPGRELGRLEREPWKARTEGPGYQRAK